MDEMQEIARFEESLEFLKDGLENQMNAELKQIESALEELKDADQRSMREKQALKNLGFSENLGTINSILEQLVFEKYHHRSNQNQLTEQIILDEIDQGKNSVVNAVKGIVNNIEGMEEDEERQLAEEKDAYETIDENLEAAINEHRSILILKKDLKAAKENKEFEQRIRTELEDIGFDFNTVEELIQKVKQIQEESYEILKEVTKVLNDYHENVKSLISELNQIAEQLEGGKRSTLAMTKRLKTISHRNDWEDAKELAVGLVEILEKLSDYVEAVIEMDQKIGRGINGIEGKVESYRDEYRREENLIG